MTKDRTSPSLRTRVASAAIAAALLLAGCSSSSTDDQPGPTAAPASTTEFFAASSVHSIDVTFDEADYQAMLETYASTQDKEWISATVTIDGTTFENVGLRLKGNSSLRGLTQSGRDLSTIKDSAVEDSDETYGEGDTGDGSADASNPAELPWLIRLDKYVDGQEYQGRADFVVRGNNSESSLNEALALSVLGESGLATQQAAAVRFTVNDHDTTLRLVIELPDDDNWVSDNFGENGILYKADSDGDYSYRGDDPDSYVDVFDVKSGEEDYTPLIAFLDFINNSTDEDFAENLSTYMDVESFATYLAVQDLINNDDDIDGPGNNSYLYYDNTTKLFTVVAWDHNLAYGGMPGQMGGGQNGAPGGNTGTRPSQGQRPDGATTRDGQQPQGFEPPDGVEMPEGMELPDGFELPDGVQPPDGMGVPDGAERPEGFEPTNNGNMPGGGGGGGFGGRSNVLVNRFLANETYASMVEESLSSLTDQLYTSGTAAKILEQWATVLKDGASDLVSADVISSEAESIARYFTE